MRLIFLFIPFLLVGQTNPNLNSNLESSLFDSGYIEPMQTEFISSIDYLVAEKSGHIYLSGDSTPIISLQVYNQAEAGLEGIAYKKINNNHYVWSFYVQGIFGDNHVRISRHAIDIDNNIAVFQEDILNDFETDLPNHYGGTIKFVKSTVLNSQNTDYWLLITFGDNQKQGRAQLDQYLNGKIILIDPFTGAGHPNNPLYDSLNPFSVESRTFAKGFRNPFRCVIIQDLPVLIVGVCDVMADNFEEYTPIQSGDNGGWWYKQGFDWQTTPLEILNEKLPAFTYTHDSVDFQTINGTVNYSFNGVSIVGGVTLEGFGYDGWLLFSDFFRDELLVGNIQNDNLVDVQSLGFMEQSFNSHFTQYNGYLYVTNFANGNIYQIEYGGSLGTSEFQESERLLHREYYNVLTQKVNPESKMILIEVSTYQNRIQTKKIINERF